MQTRAPKDATHDLIDELPEDATWRDLILSSQHRPAVSRRRRRSASGCPDNVRTFALPRSGTRSTQGRETPKETYHEKKTPAGSQLVERVIPCFRAYLTGIRQIPSCSLFLLASWRLGVLASWRLGVLARVSNGGEEFAVIAVDVAPSDLKPLSERVLRAIRDLSIDYHGSLISLTWSIGAAAYHPEDRVEDLLERADQALYQAKQSGRDQVIVG